ncbi:MAG: UDP-2,3-diacylglucosamine diphosphatase [Bacteroidales bacterium]|nr:UDP-2,3-diacylglucosamine diphosphatase [Bacteroidales bacterium]MDE6870679.1 UDP-2,3-diacylglucosamine diphosphatase [Bacteroidales bacterium]MDE7128653.1 UDP-2,3-diacylglucosamine diphosphatase [Bacteroidales bacterium]
MLQRKQYKTIVVSDIHLGYKQSKVREVSRFLSSVDCERLILNGDIIDGWKLRKSGDRKWKPEYTKFLKIIMKMMENFGTGIIYVVGNHDDFLDNVAPFAFSEVSIVRDYVLESGGHRYFVTHGDVFDSVTSNMKWLAKLGDIGYRALLKINVLYNGYRKWRGKPYYSLAQAVKAKVKKGVSSISGLDDMVVDVAMSHGCDGVICGHIHQPEDRMIGNVRYLNSGDWVETMSALIEDMDGNWSIFRYQGMEGAL